MNQFSTIFEHPGKRMFHEHIVEKCCHIKTLACTKETVKYDLVSWIVIK